MPDLRAHKPRSATRKQYESADTSSETEEELPGVIQPKVLDVVFLQQCLLKPPPTSGSNRREIERRRNRRAYRVSSPPAFNRSIENSTMPRGAGPPDPSEAKRAEDLSASRSDYNRKGRSEEILRRERLQTSCDAASNPRESKIVNRKEAANCLDLSSFETKQASEEARLQESRDQHQALTALNIGFNGLPQLPLRVFRFRETLDCLYLDGNNLTQLPPYFGHLKNLREFTINGNLLISLPPSLCCCTKLERLEVCFQRINPVYSFD